MESESIVYGCIRDWSVADADEQRNRSLINLQAVQALPEADGWELFHRDLFGCSTLKNTAAQSQVIHFGSSYRSVEYEWAIWVQQFESLLKRMYWASAVVHLETETNGTHTFRWESEQYSHQPSDDGLQVRCVWERESSLRL
ncbi:MAG TPA: hypothetical protein GX719_07725 [Gammaproteobacteria bacterium]|nr:hypothetical protein [Gammaproteobacteria bacterium]